MTSPQQEALVIGLMSGTSLDGIDAAMIKADPDEITTIHTLFTPFDSELRQQLADLASATDWAPDYYHRIEHQLTRHYSTSIKALLQQANINASDTTAIACHGQTVRHRPDIDTPYTVQMVNGALLAELTGITVVTDFRARDMAAGGEGAPLAPGFHHHYFSPKFDSVAVVNIGGFANVTYWDKSDTLLGFDTGPGNVLMDAWMQDRFGKDFDSKGSICSTGRPDQGLLATMSQDSYFSKPAPKSTGREYFNMGWLQRCLAHHPDLTDVDVLATLAELTCSSIADEVDKLQIRDLFICGGGVNNDYLMSRLQQLLPSINIASTAAAGIDPDFVEAIAFAWFGYRTLNRQVSNCPSVTGARGPRILGAIYPC